ncbi:MAG: integrase core domain-containing protein, partial [Thermodesulfovibrionales bacterium]|nr:integrase core domain-containing protein [Thermodesulfovibrionales bacterium]
GRAEREYKDKPKGINEHWHTDIMYMKVLGMWCFLITLIDGYSRYVVGHKVMLDMTAQSVSLFMQEVIDKTGVKRVKLINDNGSQLISKDMKVVLSRAGICQIRIRRNHPQSNGKSERLNGLIRQECLRPNSPVTFLEVQRVIDKYIDEYNNKRLHSSIDYMRPVDYYIGNKDKIRTERAEKLAYARQKRIEENREYNQALKTHQTTSYFKEAFCLI